MSTPLPVRASARLYRLVLRVFPRRFRARFGSEIVDTFEELADESWRERGGRGLAALWVKTLADIARHGSGERLSNGASAYGATPSAAPATAHGGAGRMVASFIQDLGFAARSARHAPGFSLAVIATIALGIGANTAIFTVVNGILLRPLPFDDSERVVILCETHERVGDYCVASPPNVEDWARRSDAFESLGLARNWMFVLDGPDGSRALSTGVATPGWFETQRLTAATGRLFAAQDLQPGNNRVVVLSHSLWQTRFGADADIVGSTLVLDGNPFAVIGVLPADAWIHDFSGAQIWVPLTTIQDDVENRSWRGFVALGRLADNTTLAGARDEMEAVRATLAAEYPESNQGWGLRIEPLREHVAGSARSTLLLFLSAVGLVLLIACANVANLLLVRSTARAQEFAVRTAIGAGRIRLARQLLTESVLLATLGSGAGVLLAWWTTTVFLQLAPPNIPRLDEVTMDTGVLGFALLLTVATALLFGLAPTISVARGQLGESLKARSAVDRRGHGFRDALVVAELALAVMLLLGAGLLTRGFTGLLSWDPGFDRDNLVTAWGLAPPGKYETGAQAIDLFERAAAEIRGVPGVESVGLTSAGPLFGGIETEGLHIEGRPVAPPDEWPTARYYDVGTDYFDAMGITVLRGRDFESTDRAEGVPVTMINETLARRHFADVDPLGQQLTMFDRTWEIVGVVGNIRPFQPDAPVDAEVYIPKRQFPRLATFFVVRTRGDPMSVEDSVRTRLQALDPDFDLGRFRTIDEIAGGELVSPRFNMLLVGLFATVALVLAAIGTYGVMAYAVSSRTHEIGIRMALGARPAGILAVVIRRGMTLAAAGLLLGVGGALALSRVLEGLLYGVSPGDPLTIVAVAAVFGAVALAACWLPARRASKLDPLVALRAE